MLDTKRGHTARVKSAENLAKIEAIRDRLNMNKQEFSIALGYVTTGGYDASTRSGSATLTFLLAAEGVERRYGSKEDHPTTNFLLLEIHSDGKMISTPIEDNPKTATIMGQEYYLVPKK